MMRLWVRHTVIGAIEHAAATASALIASKAALSEINWEVVGSATVVAALLSVLYRLRDLPGNDGEGEGEVCG